MLRAEALMRLVLRLLGYLWCLPLTLAGLVVAVLGGAVYQFTRDGAMVWGTVPTSLLERWFFVPFRAAAFTWGGVIIVAYEEDFSSRLIAHEHRHFQQAMVFGPLMPLVYLACSAWAWVRGKRPYFDNALERDAQLYEYRGRVE